MWKEDKINFSFENKMNTVENAYCRLCAELKPNNKLVNLQLNERKRQEINEKLTRLNATMDLSGDILPKTVCFVCTSALDKAFEFVIGIEQAQGVLNDILLVQQIKKETREPSFSDDDNVTYEPPEDVKNVVKRESDAVDFEQPLEELGLKVKRSGKKKTNTDRKNPGLDTIPLSQLKLTWKDYSWVCSYCDTQFSNIDELKAHSMQYHDCCNAYRCSDCNIRKLRLDSFLIHVKRHRKYLKLSCYKCNMKFITVHEANEHKSVHKTSEHYCPGCNTGYPNSEELNQHTSVYYQSKRTRTTEILERISENLTCLLCKKTFKQKGSLNTHLLIHTERKRDHTCDKCGKCFLNKQNLAGHMILHDNVRPYPCEICKAAFKTPGQLRNHVGVHDNKKPFACDQCGRCFRLQKQLTSHSIIHTDSLPYVCSFCNKRFRFKTILNQHIRQHTGVKPYSCEICQRDFTNWPNYNKHMKRRHGMDMAKKKHTPDGVYPINPATGEVIIYPETNKTIEWKEKMMQQRRPGRPKVHPQTDTQIDIQQLQMDTTCKEVKVSFDTVQQLQMDTCKEVKVSFETVGGEDQ